MTWLYIRSEPRLWTVGFYTPRDEWRAESDHSSAEDAALRVHYLNGGLEHQKPLLTEANAE